MTRALSQSFLKIAVGAAVAFMGAVPVATSAGLIRDNGRHPTDEVSFFVAAAILFSLTVAMMGPLARAAGAAADRLARAETHPAPVVALGMIVCGTVCVIASLWLAWPSKEAGSIQEAAQAMQTMARVNGNGMSFNLEAGSRGSTAGPMILTVLAFTLGAGLIGLGTWSSFGPATPAYGFGGNGHARKEPIPAADSARL